MDYISLKDAAKKWKIAKRTVQNYCTNNKIQGAVYLGNQWLIPSDSIRPIDGRSKNAKKQNEMYLYHFPMLIFTKYYSLQDELDKDELELLKIQLLYFTGNDLSCITSAQKLSNASNNINVIFGCLNCVAYSSIRLGLYHEYKNTINRMQSIIDKEIIHKEDFRLILFGVVMHLTKDPNLIYKIDVNKLSPDALNYYNYLLYISTLYLFKEKTNIELYNLKALIRKVELDECIPLLFSLNCLASLYSPIDKEEEKGEHLSVAVKSAINNNYFGALSKYYVLDSRAIDKVLEKYDIKYKNKLREINIRIMNNWSIISKLINGISILPQFNIEQSEILFLISNDVPKESIKIIKQYTDEKLEKIINELNKITKNKSFNKLKEYGKRILYKYKKPR